MCRHFAKLILYGLIAVLNLAANHYKDNRDQWEYEGCIQCELDIDCEHKRDGDSKCHDGVHEVADAWAEHTANGGQIISGAGNKITHLVVLEIIQFELLKMFEEISA